MSEERLVVVTEQQMRDLYQAAQEVDPEHRTCEGYDVNSNIVKELQLSEGGLTGVAHGDLYYDENDAPIVVPKEAVRFVTLVG